MGIAIVLVATLGACTSPEQRRQASLQQDRMTCADFGAAPGSREYTDCMLSQQNRRDNEKLRALERQRISVQNTRDSVEMTRKLECDREAKNDREAGRRPRRCD
jgi:hypothetical protein